MAAPKSIPSTTLAATDQGQLSHIFERRKELFGDCALVEIIHLHDCLRGALTALEKDVTSLKQTILKGEHDNRSFRDLEVRVTSRFKVIWSVFRAHSSAEDEFIWPALHSKTQGQVKVSPCYKPNTEGDANEGEHSASRERTISESSDEDIRMEQEVYVEDHADEERMFATMDELLTQLQQELLVQKARRLSLKGSDAQETKESSVDKIMKALHGTTQKLAQHLTVHLAKEEQHCLPLVVKHLSKSEIHDLVGRIMGKRSSDMIAQILTMAVQNLDVDDREDMVSYMKQAMAGTFFDRWLSMSGWMGDDKEKATTGAEAKRPADSQQVPDNDTAPSKRAKTALGNDASQPSTSKAAATVDSNEDAGTLTYYQSAASDVTSQAELEKLIRAVARNHTLTPQQKNTTIEGLRKSVWMSNQRVKQSSEAPSPDSQETRAVESSTPLSTTAAMAPPSEYYKKSSNGTYLFAPSGESSDNKTGEKLPLFSASELAPTYHDGATGAVLGCPHYARSCKLRHPVSGRLYTCRLCCEQQRDMPSRVQDEPLDRYSVSEIMCMKCNSLQPANETCVNTNCESHGKPFAKYCCRICNLYDDRSRPIFHCPYCNTCRTGLGLGIDFRHCMRCNACVSLSDKDHRCIPQKLQGSCPICHESLFQSTEPLRGLKCGHVMHLSCFTEYRRWQNYTCPLCMKSMEDMSDQITLWDEAVRMQPMPAAYLTTMCTIYCQDCEKMGECQYHFVGRKCPSCGSYNTRVMNRFNASNTTSGGAESTGR